MAVAVVIHRANRPDGDRDIGPIPEENIEQAPTGEGPLVVVVGDSITHSAREVLHEVLDDHTSLIAAVPAEGFAGGPYTEGALDGGDPLMLRAARRYSDLDPAVAVVALGTNDAWSAALDIDRSLEALDKLVRVLDGACLVVVLPQREVAAQPSYSTEDAAAIQERLRAVADEVIDWEAAVASQPGLVVEDGVHLTDAGKLVWSAEVADAVGRCTPS